MITKSILLTCGKDRAFELFTGRISEWWPPERRHTKDPNSRIVLSPNDGFFERDAAGNAIELGQVLAWDPPDRLELHWFPGTDRDHPTHVAVQFIAEGLSTKVVVIHAATTSSQALFPIRAERYDASWNLVLAALGRAAALEHR